MAIIGIVAVDRNGAIGKGGQLPWHYSADMRFFKEQTTGHACLMGYKTWQTLKRPLPGRLNVVLSRRAGVEPRESVVWLRDKESALSLVEYLRCDLYVIGGAQVFRAFLGEIERWVVTEVPLAVEGADTFMPAGFLEGFRAYDTRTLDDGLRVTFYERAGSSAPSMTEGLPA
jgi:dihydrofolate reductase